MVNRRRVVITGLGVTTPIGIGIEPFWDALINSRCGIKPIESFDAGEFPSRIAGELPELKIRDSIPKTYRKSVKVMSQDIKIAVTCAYHAVVDAGLNTRCIINRGEAQGEPNVDSTRFGANIGAGLVCADLPELAGALVTAADEDGNLSLQKWGSDGMNNLTPLWLLKFLPNMLACHVTIVHDTQGPSNTITCGEASSHLAIGEAFRTIARGDADVCICGGAESKLNPTTLFRQHLGDRLNTQDNDQPQSACKPFGAHRRGSVAAEGGGLIILESYEHAKNRGAKIYAELCGFGASCRTTDWLKPDPKGAAISLAIDKAMKDANVTTDEIDLVNPLGIGTVEHDASEMTAWNNTFKDRLTEIPAITTRGATGNNGAGSGAIDFAAMVVAMHRNTVPVSINTNELDAKCMFGFVQNDPVDVKIDLAISAMHSLSGGQCAALVIKRMQE